VDVPQQARLGECFATLLDRSAGFSGSGRVQVYGGSAPVLAIADALAVDGPVLRYRPEQTDDGLTGAEGTFTICSGWRRRWR
jgi:GH15 family glucan-1,4-alpha-glucosidase